MDDNLEQTREKIIKFVKEKKRWIIYIFLAIIVWFGTKIRLSNLHLLKDVTTGDYTVLGFDPYIFLRYAQYIVDNGKLMVNDAMRYVPLGLETARTNPFLSYTIAYLYKIIKVFIPSITLANVDVLYPVIFFVPTLIIFFFLVKRLFNSKVALLSTAFLAVIPTFLLRSIAGFSDKEPLGIFLMFLALYLYVIAWQSKKIKIAVLFGALSGVSTGLMNLAWGGGTFLLIIIPLFNLVEIFLDKFTKKDLYIFTFWFISAILPIAFIEKFDIIQLTSVVLIVPIIVLTVGFVLIHLIKRNKVIKEKIKSRIPPGLASLIVALLFVFLITSIFFGPLFMPKKIKELSDTLINPFEEGRIASTIIESKIPYFTDWKDLFGGAYLCLFLLGSILLLYHLLKPIKKFKWPFIIIYTLFLLSFIFSRYSQTAGIFNGANKISILAYVWSLIGFILFSILFYIYLFKKNKEIFKNIKKLNKNYVFVFILFLMIMIAARDSIRLFFVLAPITTILISYLIIKSLKFSNNLKDRKYRFIAIGIIILILFSPLSNFEGILIKFSKRSLLASENSAPLYNQQWQQAMKWVRENTPQNSVFAHWWDYGYWVQTGGNRNTILDGGNFIVYWDYLMARQVLTTPDERTALEFLKTHDATHLLIISDDSGKYPAFSNIGSDKNYDRHSWMGIFMVEPEYTKNVNPTEYAYSGKMPLDEDFIYDGKLFPKQKSNIIAFFLPIKKQEDNIIIEQPSALLVYREQKVKIPIECVYFDKEYTFDKSGLKGCIKLVPTQESNNEFNRGIDFLAGALYLSERGRKTLWAKLFLFNKKSEFFKEVYNDEIKIPLSIYNRRLIGPLKIWEISYPGDIKENPEYLNTDYPEEVQ